MCRKSSSRSETVVGLVTIDSLGKEGSISGCQELYEPIEVDYTFKWKRPLPLTNVKVNGESHSPTYSPGGDIDISWSFQEAGLGLWKVSEDEKPEALIRVCDAFGTLCSEFSTIGAIYMLSNSELISIFGSEPDSLRLSVSSRIGELESEGLIEIIVTKS